MNNHDLQNIVLDQVEKGCTVLVESERFAQQLRSRYRKRRIDAGDMGWEMAAVWTFNDWAARMWEELWPETRPAPAFIRWHLLHESIRYVPPPEPLVCDIHLVTDLDGSFESCLRYGLDPGRGGAANRLVEWRRSLWNVFEQALSELNLFHPASLARNIAQKVREFPGLIARRTSVVGFEFAGHWERMLLEMIVNLSGGSIHALPVGENEAAAVVYSDPEQEIYGLVEDLASASRSVPLHEMAVVLLDPTSYSPLLSKSLEDAFGPPLSGDLAAYNLLPDRSLADHPLFISGMLPLSFADEGEARIHLFSLLRSPYYETLSRWSRRTAQWDRAWREKGIDRGFKALVEGIPDSMAGCLPEKEDFVRGIEVLLAEESRPVSRWIDSLTDFWHRMGFPVIAGELDQLAWQWLSELFEQLRGELGSIPMTTGRFCAWMRKAAEGRVFQRAGEDDAGIQVMGRLDIRGMTFERLYIPGFIRGVLPQPPKTLPFLDAAEKKRVLGGSAEIQYDFARLLVGQFHAAGPNLVLSRPMMDRKGEPCLLSPFWDTRSETHVSPIVPWRVKSGALHRVRWVTEGMSGIHSRRIGDGVEAGDERQPAYRFESFQVQEPGLPGEITVSTLETLMQCPSIYFFRDVLGLEELPRIEGGVDPALRGLKIHRILASFGRRIKANSRLRKPGREEAARLLREVVEEEFGPDSAFAHWSVEKKRLLGSAPDTPGLLDEWFDREQDLADKGWEWSAFESGFEGLRIDGCSVMLRGRLDRLDFHPSLGIRCWDYKTGNLPRLADVLEHMVSPQLPAYLLALEKGLMPEIPVRRGTSAAGYVDLRSVRQLRHWIVLKACDATAAFLEEWQRQVGAVLEQVRSGNMSPCWINGTCERTCPFECLCDFIDRPTPRFPLGRDEH